MWHADPDRRQALIARARRPLIVAAIVGGAILQHVLVTAPAAPAPAPAHPATATHPSAPGAPTAHS